MKLSEWFKARSGQELMMIAVVAMLLVMIATRWAYISRTAKEAIRQRFVPPAEQADSLQAKSEREVAEATSLFRVQSGGVTFPAMLPATVFFPTAATGSALTPAPKIP